MNLSMPPIYGSDRIGQVAYEEEIYRVPFSSNLQETTLSFNLDKREGMSGYKNWISPANKLINTLGGDNWDSHIKLIGFANGAYSSVDLASEMIGYSGNNIAVAEDMEGTLQFISAIPETHSGHKNICLIYDRTGRLMKNSHKIRSDAQAKPIVLKQQGANEIYYLFTIGENQRPYYHVIDMGMNGFAKANENAMGMVTEKNNPMDETSSYRYGYHMALIEDHLTGSGILYMTRYIPSPSPDQPGNTEIVAFDFSGDAAVPAPFVVTRIPGYDLKGLGELQISADGKKLAYYNRQKSVAGFAHQLVEINLITLSEDRKSALNIVKVDGSQGGTYGKSSVEVAQSGDDVYFNQWGVYKLPENQTEKNVFRYRLNTVASQLTSAPYGELRRGSDGKLYVASQGQDHSMYTIEEGEDGTIIIGESPVAAAGLGYELSGNLPSQPYRLSGEHETYFHRLTSAKHYELKDHLGNVRAVVGDQRGAKIDNDILINYPEVLTYSDYYPFGMAMHGRTYNFGDYRYGFNGKEKDDKGEWGSTHYDYGFRIYNPQVAKFLSVDPLAKSYPMLTPYQFASNKPINGIDLDGLEWVLQIHSPDHSEKFLRARQAGDIYRLKQLTYYSLNRSFPDDYLHGIMAGENFEGNKASTVIFDEKAAPGLTVKLTGGIYKSGELYSAALITQPIHYPIEKGFYYDMNWPVDIRATKAWEKLYGKEYVDGKGNDVDLLLYSFGFEAYMKNKSAGSQFYHGRLKGFGPITLNMSLYNTDGLGIDMNPLGGFYGNYLKVDDIEAPLLNATQGLNGRFKFNSKGIFGNGWLIQGSSAPLPIPLPPLLEGAQEIIKKKSGEVDVKIKNP